jgi:vacuolar-type H+-ATPase subunit E/Vma4
MYTIDNKVDLFQKMVYEKKKEEKEKEIKKLKIEYEEKLKDLDQEYISLKKDTLEKTRKEAEKEKKQIVSKAKVRVQKRILEEKGKILDIFDEYLHENIKKYLDTSEYNDYFKEELKKVLNEINEEDYAEITLRKNDENLLDLSNYNVNFSQDIIGGFYVIKNHNIKYDFTIDSKIDENSEYIGYLVKEIFGSKEGENIGE